MHRIFATFRLSSHTKPLLAAIIFPTQRQLSQPRLILWPQNQVEIDIFILVDRSIQVDRKKSNHELWQHYFEMKYICTFANWDHENWLNRLRVNQIINFVQYLHLFFFCALNEMKSDERNNEMKYSDDWRIILNGKKMWNNDTWWFRWFLCKWRFCANKKNVMSDHFYTFFFDVTTLKQNMRFSWQFDSQPMIFFSSSSFTIYYFIVIFQIYIKKVCVCDQSQSVRDVLWK